MRTHLKNKEHGDEVWKRIELPELKHPYFVSSYGRIKNKRGKILSSPLNSKGYPQLSLQTKDGRKSYKVHRLVAITFIPNPNNYPQVNHIDGDKTNSTISNLEWCTNSMNQLHANRTGLNKNRIDRSIEVSSKPVDMFDLNMQKLATFKNARIADRVTGISYKMISMVVRGKCKNASGYIFKLHGDENDIKRSDL